MVLVLVVSTFLCLRESRLQGSSEFDNHNAFGSDSSNSIYNSTLGFEKIFAINLPERTDHRDELVLASSVTGIKVDFVSGIHGDVILDEVLPPHYNKNLSNN